MSSGDRQRVNRYGLTIGLLGSLALLLLGCGPSRTETAGGSPPATETTSPQEPSPAEVTVGLFNVKELSVEKVDARDPQLLAATTILEMYRPDILVLNEIDAPPEDPTGPTLRFRDTLLRERGLDTLYPHVFVRATNTGELSGHDLDNDGTIATAEDVGTRDHGNDSFGFGTYPGQYGMALLSRFPIAENEARTFQKFLWADLPGNHLPQDWYSEAEQEVLRLSSKSHWDVPVVVGEDSIHLLLSHPTPPVFDGDEDRNGRRNFDEIAFWSRYLSEDPNESESLMDDTRTRGGLGRSKHFVVAGDLNAHPEGDVTYQSRTAISQLLDHPQIQESAQWLVSRGAPQASDAAATTAWGRPEPIGKRIDYLLPSRSLKILDGGVHWPPSNEDPDGHELALLASDHRFLWLRVQLSN